MMYFVDSLSIGRTGEDLVQFWLQKNGYDVQRVSSPRQLFQGKWLVVPDLVASKTDEKIRVEVKKKERFSWHFMSRRWVTGIDFYNYSQYKAVRDAEQQDVWLLFLQMGGVPNGRDIASSCPDRCPTGLFGGKLSYLVDHENHRHENHGNSGMVYWSSDVLTKYLTVEELFALNEERFDEQMAK